MNRLDLFLMAILLLAGLTGWRRGAVHRVLSWGGLAAGVVGGALLAPVLATRASDPLRQMAIALGTLVVAGALGSLGGRFLGSLIRGTTKDTALGTMDSLAGCALSVAVVAFVSWFLALNLSNGPFPRAADEIRSSAILRALDSALPAPPDLVAQVRDLFSRFDFPQVFAGLPPAPAGPVQGPSEIEAAAAFDAAADSTVRVVGRACDRVQEGSGFVVAPDHVITNAHVVAGVSEPLVQQHDGQRSASVVLFDPSLDVAVLRVPDAPGVPLPLAGEEVDRGTGGAVLGYPGGGNLTGEPAAVTQVIDARGRDIYGKRQVVRRVYELQTTLAGGNSGGPFVLPDGRVGGMVFAASTTDPDVGYAITATQLERDLQRGVERVEPVSTGRCAT